jgi:hypothetical protein
MHLPYKTTLILAFSLLVTLLAHTQIPVGTWRDHLPYNNGKVVAITNDRIYCATDLALFYYEKNDDAIYKMSKINKLSDLEVGYIAYNEATKKLLIGYLNGNIDLLKGDTLYSFPDIKLKNVIADKSIYHIHMEGDLAYISTGFGIVVFNMTKNEFAETYIIGKGGSYLKINSTALYNNEIYALTDNGVFKGNLDDPFLNNFKNWTQVDSLLNPNEKYLASTVLNNTLYLVNSINSADSFHMNSFNGQLWDTMYTDMKRFKSIDVYNNKLTLVSNGFVDVYNTSLEKIINYNSYYANYGVYDKDENLWVANTSEGLLLYNTQYSKKILSPNGPGSKNIFKVYHNNGNMLIAPGGHRSTGENSYSAATVYKFSDELWQNLNGDKENASLLRPLRDVCDFASQQNKNHYMAATWSYGLIEVENNKVTNVFTNENTDSIFERYSRIGGITYDDNGNLYMISTLSQKAFIVKTPNNKWYSYAYDNTWPSSTKKLINTTNNDKWAISNRGNGIFVYNDNATPEFEGDDVYTSFNLTNDLNITIDTRLNDIVQDLDGAIWIASGNGIAVYDNPQYALNNEGDFYARVPQIPIEGKLKDLLEGEKVTSIAVDGANRKWLGTEGGGLFLVSPDGTEQLMVWNTDNSKLFSNNIISVDINQKTGEVFIGTDKGLQSYKSTSTENRENYNEIYAFPNPVKGNYNGYITIRGLMYQTQVKITDISGHKVYETTSNGGDAIWNGMDLTGNKVASGIYLVMCTLPDGSESEVTKILIVR